MRYIEIDNERYPLVDFYRTIRNMNWDYRNTCNIILDKSYEEVRELFKDDLEWSLVTVEPKEYYVPNEQGFEEIVREEVETVENMSSYSLLGDIILHNNGLITVVMGQLTSDELLAILLGE